MGISAEEAVARELDHLDPHQLLELQLRSIRSAVEYCATHSAYYRDVLRGVRASEIRTLSDFRAAVPVIDKATVVDRNTEFRCVDYESLAEVLRTSGTTSRPLRSFVTHADLGRLADVERRTLQFAGVKPAASLGLLVNLEDGFMAGLAYWLGARTFGAQVTRLAGLPSERKLGLIRERAISVLVGPVSGVLELVRDERVKGRLGREVEKLILVGDSIRGSDHELNPVGRLVADATGAELYSNYGMTEMVGSLAECNQHAGAHVHPDLVLVEILGDDGTPVPDGTLGEVVITTLGVEGMPLLRYRSGDLSFIDTTPCGCGRTSPRVGPVVGRRRNRLKIDGVSVSAEAIVAAVSAVWSGEFLLEVFHGPEGLDRYELFLDESLGRSETSEVIRRSVRSQTKTAAVLRFAPPALIRETVAERGGRKRSRIIDRRRTNETDR